MKAILNVPVLGYGVRAATYGSILMAHETAGAALGWAMNQHSVFIGNCGDKGRETWCGAAPTLKQAMHANALGALPMTALVATLLPFCGSSENFGEHIAMLAVANLILVPCFFGPVAGSMGATMTHMDGKHGGMAWSGFSGGAVASSIEFGAVVGIAVALGGVAEALAHPQRLRAAFMATCCGSRRSGGANADEEGAYALRAVPQAETTLAAQRQTQAPIARLPASFVREIAVDAWPQDDVGPSSGMPSHEQGDAPPPYAPAADADPSAAC